MNPKLEPIIRYILSILIRGDEELAGKIAYAKTQDLTALVTIQASDFFDEAVYLTKRSRPQLPLKVWHRIPLLFGEPWEEVREGRLIIHADIIASAFFLMSRYEELIVTENRDLHGRFMGKGSLPGRAGFLERPVVDEYGKQIRKLLRGFGMKAAEPEQQGKIYLTHDVDVPWKKWSFISALRNCIGYTRQKHQLEIWPVQNYFGNYSHNPFDTFDWIIGQDAIAKEAWGEFCEDIYFIIGASVPDKYTESYIKDNKSKLLIEKLKAKARHIGLHISYTAGRAFDREQIQKEKTTLEEVLGRPVGKSRNHYLLSPEPKALRDLTALGITDDYTMGYADRVGFRLGTAQCICWIDPERLELTQLRLHPLIIMDSSLAEKQYMGLGKQDCIAYVRELYQLCRSVKGDFCTLFHNSIFLPGPYGWVKEVYQDLIQMLKRSAEEKT